jgi:hypothetical protein
VLNIARHESCLLSVGTALLQLAVLYCKHLATLPLVDHIPCRPAGVYTQDGECLLGTAVSNQIRVLANNDVPTGAAFIPLVVPVA